MLIKNIIFRAAEAAGLLYVVEQSKWRESRLLILCYHGVAAVDEHEWNPALYISRELLRQRIEYLRGRRYAILPLTEALNRLRDGTLPPRSVAITFDDGARDFAECALPILETYKVPTTVYLTTYYCEHRYPVFDTALAYLIWRGRASGADLGVVTRTDEALPVAELAQRARAWQLIQLLAKQRRLDAHAKNELLRIVAARLGIDFEEFVGSGLLQLMTPEQVGRLPRDLIDVQLHTHRHRTPRERRDFDREIHDNQRAIAVLTGDQALRRHFCYPSGDYAGAYLVWLADLGVESATTCVPGIASVTSHRLLLPRFIDTMHVSSETFAAWVSGFAALMPRRAANRLDSARLRVYAPALEQDASF